MKQINADKEYFGFIMQTRKHYHDDKIIAQCLDESKDVYRMPKNPKLVVDVGGNIGCVSLVAARRGANVITFEPASDNFETLVYNINVNGYQNKITPVNLGVGKPGPTKLFIHPNNSGATSSYLEQRGLTEDNYETVGFISIHDVFNKYDITHCDLLKLDCEGSEKDIINDLDDNLTSKIGQISVEFHDKKIIGELIKRLERWYNTELLHRYEYAFFKK